MNQPLSGKQRNLISRPFICPTWLLHPARRGEGREAVTGAATQPARLWEEQSWMCSRGDRRVPGGTDVFLGGQTCSQDIRELGLPGCSSCWLVLPARWGKVCWQGRSNRFCYEFTGPVCYSMSPTCLQALTGCLPGPVVWSAGGVSHPAPLPF